MRKQWDNASVWMMFTCFSGSLLLPIGKPQNSCSPKPANVHTSQGKYDLSQGKWRNLTRDVGLSERKMPASSSVRASVSSGRLTQPYRNTGLPNSGAFCCWSCILLWRWCCVHHSPGWDPGSSWEPLLLPLGEAGSPTSLFLTVPDCVSGSVIPKLGWANWLALGLSLGWRPFSSRGTPLAPAW